MISHSHSGHEASHLAKYLILFFCTAISTFSLVIGDNFVVGGELTDKIELTQLPMGGCIGTLSKSIY